MVCPLNAAICHVKLEACLLETVVAEHVWRWRMSQLQVSLHRPARRVTGVRVLSGAKSALRQFGRHSGGNVAIMAALLMPASAIAVGAAVVFSGASSGRTSMQAALDSAVLAGVGTSDVPAEQISTATNVVNSNLSNYALSSLSAIKPSFTVSDK